MLFIIAPSEHKVRIEVGYGLEPILTDALSEVILQTQVLPKFRYGDYNGGVTSGVDALITQLSASPSEAEAKVVAAGQQAQSNGDGKPDPLGIIIAVLFIGFAIFRVFGGWGFLPFLFMGSGGFGGGNFGGGSFGGGGFGGGGGSFGGGGASGDGDAEQADHERITAAIEKAESRTSGEIFCVLAQEVSRYREVPLVWAALAGLVLPPIITFLASARWRWAICGRAGPTAARAN